MIKTCKDRCKDTYQPPLRLWAGRLCGLLAAAGLSGCRRGKAGRWSAGGGWAAVIRRRSAAVFNRLLNISPSAFDVCGCFVFVLCHSAIPAGAAWPMMAGGPRPGSAAAAPGPGCSRQAGRLAGRQVLWGGSGKSGGLSGNGGRIFPHPPSDPSGVSENMAAGSLESWPEIIWGLCLAFKISSFYKSCFERNLWYFKNRQNYTNPCSEVFTMPCKKKKGGRKGC